MAVIVPEILLYRVLESGLSLLREDAQINNGKYINQLFDGVFQGKHIYGKEAINLFRRREGDDPRYVDLRLFFDANKASIPTIHITLPQEDASDDINSIGAGEDGYSTVFSEDEGVFSENKQRNFRSTFRLIITSDNHRETLIIYHTIKALLIATLPYIDIAGLRNPKLGGGEIKIDPSIIPSGIYTRAITISCYTEISVPEPFSQEIIKRLVINPGIPNVPDMSGSTQL